MKETAKPQDYTDLHERTIIGIRFLYSIGYWMYPHFSCVKEELRFGFLDNIKQGKVFKYRRKNIWWGVWIARIGIFACEIDDAEGERDGRGNKEEDYRKRCEWFYSKKYTDLYIYIFVFSDDKKVV